MSLTPLICGTSTGADVANVANSALYATRPRSKSTPQLIPVTSAADVVVVSGGATVTYETAPNGRPAVKVVFTASSVVEFTKSAGLPFAGEAAVVALFGKDTGVASVTTRVYQNVGSNQQFFKQYVCVTSPFNNYKEQGGALTLYNNSLGWGSSGTPSASFNIEKLRLTLAPDGGTGTVWLFGFATSFLKRKSRICVMFDDGYSSLSTLGAGVLYPRGIRSTLGVIPSAVDQNLAGYMTLQEIQAYAGAGNAVVAHGTGNITEDFPTVQDAIDSVAAAIKWIDDKGLSTPGHDTCYVWPMARFQNTTGQTAYLDGVLGLGVTLARSANPLNAATQSPIGCLTKYNRLALPTIGHSFAGTTAAEATNIANLVTTINTVADQGGLDVFLLLHKVVVDSTPDGSMSLSIRQSDLATLCNAIQAKVGENKLEAVTMPELSAWYSNAMMEI